MPSEFVPFDEVAQELGMQQDQLKKLISSGAIRAFSDGGTFKFRRKDLDKFKARRQSEPTIVIPDKVEVVESPRAAAAAPPPPPPAPTKPPAEPEPELDLVQELMSAPPEAPEKLLEIEPPVEPSPEPAVAAEPLLAEEIAAAEPPAEPGIPELTLEDLEPSSSEKTTADTAPPAAKTQATDELSLDDLLDLGGGGTPAEEAPAATQEVVLESSAGEPEVISIDTGGLDLAPEGDDPSVTAPIELDDEAAGAGGSGNTGATVSLDVSPEAPFGFEGEAEGAEKPDEFPSMPSAGLTGLEQRAEGTPLWAAVVAATTLILFAVSVTLVGAFQDYTPSYLAGMKSWFGGVR